MEAAGRSTRHARWHVARRVQLAMAALPELCPAGGSPPCAEAMAHLGCSCPAAEFTSELCAETWVVKDGTATALLKGVRIEGAGEQVRSLSTSASRFRLCL
jgi:hypothetical protein